MPRKSKKLCVRPKTSGISLDGNVQMWKKRMREVDGETQDLLNEHYKQGLHWTMMRFEENESIIYLWESLYHMATVKYPAGCALPDTFFPKGTSLSDIEPEKRVCTYKIHLEGWPAYREAEAFENEMISRLRTDELCFLQGILFAHEWNKLMSVESNVDIKPGALQLEQDEYDRLDKKWQEQTGRNTSFTSYCRHAIADGDQENFLGKIEVDAKMENLEKPSAVIPSSTDPFSEINFPGELSLRTRFSFPTPSPSYSPIMFHPEMSSFAFYTTTMCASSVPNEGSFNSVSDS